MSVDDRIRDALEAAVTRPDLDLDLDRVEVGLRTAVAGRTRRRHRTVVVTTSLLAAAAAVLVAVVVWPGPNHETVNTGAILPPATTPARAGHLLALRGGALVELSATTGAVERTLVTSGAQPVVAMAASGDGRFAYVVRPPSPRRVADALSIDRVDLTTGAVTSVVRSAPTPAGIPIGGPFSVGDVVVATDIHGTRVAWAARFDPVTILTVETGRRVIWHPPGVSARPVVHRGGSTTIYGGTGAVDRLLWSPDDRHLAISTEGDSHGVRVLDVEALTPAATAILVPGMTEALSYERSTRDLIGWSSCGRCLPTMVAWSGSGRPTTYLQPRSDARGVVIGRDAHQLFLLDLACTQCLEFVGYDVYAGDGVHTRSLGLSRPVDDLVWIP
jgi:hypothetical protein